MPAIGKQGQMACQQMSKTHGCNVNKFSNFTPGPSFTRKYGRQVSQIIHEKNKDGYCLSKAISTVFTLYYQVIGKKHSTILKNLGSISKVFLLASTLRRKNLSGMSLWSHADRKVFAIIQSSRVFIPIHMLNYSNVSKSLNKKQSQRFSEVERVKSNYRYCLHPIWDGCFTMIISVTTVYLTNYKFSYLVMEINQKRAKKI